MGASLLAIAVHQSTSSLTDTQPSRAGSLLQRDDAVFVTIAFIRPGCGTMPATFSHTRIDNAHERPPHSPPRAQEA
ncbi:hypothetical protein CS076_16650 [Pseudomonas prosekii]|uniref:Uncharacterized protein n=1 Tax=Pseudomonas prosekii TaxID=1148509 RepID=A0A3L8CK44_9PSED|nr:hypothetical protein CS076_16650 [Pseudomonas prosekii]